MEIIQQWGKISWLMLISSHENALIAENMQTFHICRIFPIHFTAIDSYFMLYFSSHFLQFPPMYSINWKRYVIPLHIFSFNKYWIQTKCKKWPCNRILSLDARFMCSRILHDLIKSFEKWDTQQIASILFNECFKLNQGKQMERAMQHLKWFSTQFSNVDCTDGELVQLSEWALIKMIHIGTRDAMYQLCQ